MGSPTQSAKRDILITPMAYGGDVWYKVGTWLAGANLHLHTRADIGQVYIAPVDRAPVAAARNEAALTSLKCGADLLVMVDHDVAPADDWLPAVLSEYHTAISLGRPAGVWAAPAICSDGRSNVAVWTSPPEAQFEGVDFDEAAEVQQLELWRLGAAESALLTGIQEVAAVGTGAIVIDTRIFRHLAPPWFAVEYTDEYEIAVGTGEDIYFTRACSEDGLPVSVMWDHWAKHRRASVLDKVRGVSPMSIPTRYRELWDLSQQK